MTDPSPALIDIVARAIHDIDRYDGAFDMEIKAAADYPRAEAAVWEARRLARAALDAMTSQTPQDATHGTNTTQPTPTDNPATTGPQTGAQGRELWQVWADGYLAAQRGAAETTNPYAETCPTCGGYGMVMSWGGASDCPNDCWHGMVPKSTAGIGDTAPIALDKIRARLDQYRNTHAHRRPSMFDLDNLLAPIFDLDNLLAPIFDLDNLLDDLQAILDTAQEHHA